MPTRARFTSVASFPRPLMKVLFAAAFVFASIVASSVTAPAAAPSLMSYQGRVSDASGTLIGATTPVNRTVTFKFYSTSTGGTPLYAEAQTVTISAGEFSVLLGNGTGVATFPGPSAPALTPYITLPSIMTGAVYLGVTVDDGTAAADPEIAPRQQIVSAAYAFRAQVAESVLSSAVSTTMLADTSVTTAKIGGGAITNAKLASDAVNTTNIVAGSINESRLANGAVTNAKLAANVVTSDKIADGTITTADLADGAINGARILDGAIGSVDLADGGVATADLANGAVTTAKIADGAIDYNKLAAAIQQSLTPVGTIIAYAGDNAPPGWLLCNGQTVSRSTYAALYSVVGNRFGYGNNSSTFHVPDLRGQFLRGRDTGAGRDPDRNSRSAMNAGGATGDAVGSVQGDAFASHSHPYHDIYYSESGGDSSIYNNGRGSGDTDGDNEPWQISRTTSNTGSSETRPENAYVNFIIKY